MICNNVKQCYNEVCHTDSSCSTCRYETRDSKVLCLEKGKRYVIQNPEKVPVVKFHMDGGIIRDEKNVVKCDYLVGIKDEKNPTAIFVELKGKNIHHALEQIEGSLSRYASAFQDHKILARIVGSSVPKITNNPSDLKIRKRIKEKYHADLLIRENNLDERYY